jgi:hypothetical protein
MKLFVVGLDLGQSVDYSAISIIEAGEDYLVRYLSRWKLGTPYPKIVEDVEKLMSQLPTGDTLPILAIDQTGVGAPVVDMFRALEGDWYLRAIHITGGSGVSIDRGVTYVPKRDLVAAVVIALQTDQLKVSPKLDHAKVLKEELGNFKVRISDSGHDSYGAGDDWRSGNHDDMVLSVAMGVWCAKRAAPVEITFT